MKLFVATLLISTIVFVAWFYIVLPSMKTERRLEILREVRRTNQRSIRRIALLSKYAKATNHY